MKNDGDVTSAEGGSPVTMTVAESASGSCVLLFFISRQKYCRDCCIVRGTDGFIIIHGGRHEMTVLCVHGTVHETYWA